MSSTSLVASGVTSLGPRPVPPVVSTRSSFPPSHHLRSTAEICPLSSGTISRQTWSHPSRAMISPMASPLVSALSPFEPASLMVKMPN